MLRFEWNALRTGDHVLVHDPRTAEMTLTHGVVASVDTHKGANGVGIRVRGNGGEATVLWPSHIALRRDPREPSGVYWRCQEPTTGARVPVAEVVALDPIGDKPCRAVTVSRPAMSPHRRATAMSPARGLIPRNAIAASRMVAPPRARASSG